MGNRARTAGTAPLTTNGDAMTELKDRPGGGAWVPESPRPPGPAPTPSPPLDLRAAIYKMMVEMRDFETRAYDLFLQGLVKGTSHLGLGQEAVAAGFAAAMRPSDYTFATYRGHNHTLARGASMTAVMAELMGRQAGLMAGKGGSMHLTSVAHRMMGSYAIVGAHLTIANGAAWSSKVLGTGDVVVCFFGDGTTNIGAFHEALNLAVVWKLPVVFVCENNHWMEYTPISSVTAVAHPAADRAGAYGLDPVLVDGNDADATYGAAAGAIEHARAGGGPSLVEAETYRHGGHSRADPGKYRPESEVKEWLARDPIPRYRARLLDAGVEEAVLRRIEEASKAAVDAAATQAQASPPPDSSLVESEVFADGGSSWRR